MNSRFVLDHAGLSTYLRTDPELAAVVRARAELAVSFAQQIAPVGSEADGDDEPGRYRDGIECGSQQIDNDRLMYPITNPVPYAAAVERRHHVMRRVRAAFSDPKGGSGF